MGSQLASIQNQIWNKFIQITNKILVLQSLQRLTTFFYDWFTVSYAFIYSKSIWKTNIIYINLYKKCYDHTDVGNEVVFKKQNFKLHYLKHLLPKKKYISLELIFENEILWANGIL